VEKMNVERAKTT